MTSALFTLVVGMYFFLKKTVFSNITFATKKLSKHNFLTELIFKFLKCKTHLALGLKQISKI